MENTASITSGTWSVTPGNTWEFAHPEVMAGEKRIAAVLHGPDAALIAAAPGLLVACKAAIAALSQPALYPADADAAKAFLRAAIAQVEGDAHA